MKKMAGNGRNVYSVKIGAKNPSKIDIRLYARIKNAIWDQLQATKAQIVQS